MNHWDLTPNETVTLTRETPTGAVNIRASFRFRTTTRALFLLDEHRVVDLWLREDGQLEERFRIRDYLRGGSKDEVRVWRIKGVRANTRVLLGGEELGAARGAGV